MKTHSGYQSCSCTSCTYRSESDRPSLKRFITQGSRIDRLYYGKYIPLRERKLLERLVRTRGVYDDIRAQLISDSTISLDKKAVLKPGRKTSAKNLEGIGQTKTILGLVDQVDRGEILGSNDLSGCCSCCNCSSKIDINNKSLSKHRYHRVNHDVYKHRNNRRGVRFKTKHIRSDPCTCTYKFSGMIKNVSKRRRIIHPITLVDLQPTTDEELTQRSRKVEKTASLSKEKLQEFINRSKEVIMEGIRKSTESNAEIRKKLDLQAKKSIEKLKKVKKNIKDKIKYHRKVQEKNNADLRSCKCPHNDLISQIRKDSLSKFRDDLRKKQIMKNWECEPECIEDICVPEECFYKLKRRNSHLLHKKDIIKGWTATKSIRQPSIKFESKKISSTKDHLISRPKELVKQKPLLRKQLIQEVSKVQPGRLKKQSHKKELKSTSNRRSRKSNTELYVPVPSIHDKKIKNTQKIHPYTQTPPINIYKKGKPPKPERETNQSQVVRIGSSFSFNIEFYKNRKDPHIKSSRLILQDSHLSSIPMLMKSSRERNIRQLQRASQVELKQPTSNTKIGDTKAKRFKLKQYRNKPKHEAKDTRKYILSNKSVLTTKSPIIKFLNMKTNTYNTSKNMKREQKILRKIDYLFPYECEHGVCDPYNCDPYQCIELINKRKKKVKERSIQSDYSPNNVELLKNKSTTILSSRSYVPLKDKIVQIKNDSENKTFVTRKNDENSYNKNNQVVRIGSSISFSLEFYKNKSPHLSKLMNSEKVIIENNLKQLKLPAKQKEVNKNSIYNATLNKTTFRNSLKRCFCTLKLQDKQHVKTKKNKKVVTDKDLMNSHIMTHNKSTKTKKGKRLKPYECEPFVCTPGACDPYLCLERINQRLKDIGSITDRPETRDVSSITFSKKSLKNIHIQSIPKPIDRKLFATTGSNLTNKYSLPTNQSVKIGSTFSFNIEFYKNNNKLNGFYNEVKSTSLLDKKDFRKSTRNKLNKMNKLNVAHVTTQRQDAKKLNKSSMASHLVKRCFCTLNLQKHRRKQHEKSNRLSIPMQNQMIAARKYTINRALIDTTMTLNKNNTENDYNNSRDLLYRYNNRISSLYSSSVQNRSETTYLGDYMTSRSYFKQTEVTNLSHYIKNCFCTMNLQLASKNISKHKPKTNSVKIGSNFSFNIDFIKNSLPLKNKNKINFKSGFKSNPNVTKLTNMKVIGTENKSVSHNQKSQSGFTENFPSRERCFCTLKLQKKGRWHKKHYRLAESSKIISPSKATVKSVNKSQNTTFKPIYIAHSLKPYECEPNICTPGECNPYQCLEIMKRKKINRHASLRSLDLASSLKPYECEPNICTPGYCDPVQCLEILKRRNIYKNTKNSGIDTILQPKKSAASMTKKHNVGKGTRGSYTKNVKNIYTNDVKSSNKSFESTTLEPSKQVVRIGSNISFDIEFFKERKTPIRSQSAYKDIKEIKQDQELPKRKPRTYQVETSSQMTNDMRHKRTDVRKFPKVASTMTASFLKRCFCTAHLQKGNHINAIENMSLKLSSPSFLRKCFCLIKSMRTPKHGIHIEKRAYSNKKTETQQKLMKVNDQRDFYECEPGICIPGECNPYQCEQILRKTRMKNSKISTVDKMRSVSTHNPAAVKKNANIQSKIKSRKITQRYQPSYASFGGNDRQAVRVGSNFSFNIEFFKNNYPGNLKNYKSSELEGLSSFQNKYKNSKKKKVKDHKISTHSQLTQSITSNISRATESQKILKRCFCTLHLHNQYAQGSKMKADNIKNKLKFSTKSIMTERIEPESLKSYECEPNICVPYECDPYECEKIMKLRKEKQNKEAGILTGTPKRKSVSTTGSLKESKRKTQTVTDKKRYRKVNFSEDNKKSMSAQRVKIGSSFNFNVEFFKNKDNTVPDVKTKSDYTPKKQLEKQLQENDKNNIKKSRSNKRVQIPKTEAEAASSQTKKVDVAPGLKRCFCTLLFKKKKKPKPLKSFTADVGTETRKLTESTALLPYECEPQTCLPGQCDPYQCLERIKRRNFKDSGENTIFLQTKNVSSIAKNMTRRKTKKSQIKLHDRKKVKNLQSKEPTLIDRKRQSVRLGSNFNFNIEFYKNKNELNNTAKTLIKHMPNYSMKSSVVKLRKKQNKECDQTDCPELTKMQKFKKQKYRKSHTETSTVKNANTFLKKCFCVFKLHKLRQQNQPIANAPNLKRNDNNNYESSRHKNKAAERKLLPFECEPNICVPGNCDPYECDKIIKRRLLKSTHNVTKTAFTDNLKSRTIKLQASKIKLKHRRQNTKSRRNEHQNQMMDINNRISRNTDKQVVRVGSTFSFDIEFFKNRNINKQIPQHEKRKKSVLSHNKSISIGNKTMVSRGSKAYTCDPIKCEKRINTIEKKIKSYNMNTQVIKQCADECVGIMANSYKKKNRSSVTNTAITLPLDFKKKGKVEVPRLNRQAVKIGSNFSFNIEFSKGASPNVKLLHSNKPKTPKVFHEKSPKNTAHYIEDKIINTKSALTHNNRSQAVAETGDKSLDVHNTLNRCFCTLKLQNKIRPNKNRENIEIFSRIPPYPQTIEVRRVKVLQKNKSSLKKYASIKTVGTKINKKYVAQNCYNSPCKCSQCKNVPTTSTEMKTIFPYKATKFEKSPSKTLLVLQNMDTPVNNVNDIKTAKTNKGKKLNKKKSLRNIYYNKKEKLNLKAFLCRCAAIFASKPKNDDIVTNSVEPVEQIRSKNMTGNRLKVSKSDRRPLLITDPKLRPSKSFKLDCRYCNDCILHNKYDNKTKINHFKSQGLKKNPKLSKQILIDQTPEPTILKKKKIKNDSKLKNISICQDCCYSCGRTFDKEEIGKGAGDRWRDQLSNKHLYDKSKSRRKVKEINNKGCKGECKQIPMFEMQLKTDDYDIINKEEVMNNVVKYTKNISDDNENEKKKIKTKRRKNIIKSNKKEKKRNNAQSNALQQVLEVKDFDENNQTIKTLNNKYDYEELCDHCQKNIMEKSRKDRGTSSSPKVRFLDADTTSKGKYLNNSFEMQNSSKRKSLDKSLKEQKASKSKKSGKEIVKEEVKKGAEDRLSKENLYHSSINRLKEIFNLNNDTDNVCSGNSQLKPLFEMHLNSNDYDIINKEQFMDNVSKYSTRSKPDNSIKAHKKNCRCCICLSKMHKTGAHIHVSPKGSKLSRGFGKVFNTSKSQSPAILTNKPCTCGSFVCSKNIKKLRESHNLGNRLHKNLWKPCVCGSPICDRESAAMKAISTSPDEVVCSCQEVYDKKQRKLKMIKNKTDAKHYAERLKLLNKEDSERRHKRLQEDKHLEKRINKKSSDVILLAESAIDIGKLGITACVDILRSVARTASDPKHAYFTLKAMKNDPQLMARHLKTAFADSGVAATAKRVRLRCLAMRGVKKVKNILEKYAITNYLLHIADDDPRTRLVKKKKKPERLRERLDFGCSLYMGSLRKRPFLWVYDRCPWFYPHFLSLINVWKQFADITLFLLAVVVWSPCILCMELCRAMMCCFFCTG